MSKNRLVAAVFVLRYKEAFRSGEKYLGRAAHKLALGILEQVQPELSAQLHEQNEIMPITVSDLFQSDAHHHWMRITGLNPDVTHALEAAANLHNIQYDGWTVQAALTRMHDWSGVTTIEALVNDGWKHERTIKLHFETATAIKSKGLYRPLPDPTLIFKSLYERWKALMAVDLPYMPSTEVLDTFLLYGVSIRNYYTRPVHIPMKHAAIPAFRGDVTYFLEAPTKSLNRLAETDPHAAEALARYDELGCLLNLLTDFGFYSGVGIKTAQGMGMMRRGKAR